MGVTDRREREKEERRIAILDAAERVFEDKGFESSKMGEIAEVAELSKGTLYLYFKNKNDLFLAMSTRCVTGVVAGFAQVDKGIKSVGAAKLREYLRIYAKEVHASPKRFRMAMSYFVSNRQIDIETFSFHEHQKAVQKILGSFAKDILEGQQAGEFSKEQKPEHFAMQVWSALVGGMLLLTKMDHVQAHLPGVVDKDSFIEGFIDTQINGLRSNL